MADRHRASGDALATVKLFKLLLAKDTEKTIVKELIKTEIEKGLAPRLLDIVESLPTKTGIYYVHNQEGTIIFIGRSKNIKKRVNQHFTGTSSKCKKIQAEVFTVTFEETGSELISILKEIDEIRVNRPVYSKPQTKALFPWALYSETDSKGYLNLKLQKFDRRKKEIVSFGSLSEGKNTLFRITDQNALCQKLTGLYETETNCFLFTINECDGACIGEVSPEIYNDRVAGFITSMGLQYENVMLIDRGRTLSERSAILIENGIFIGYAFYELNYQINNISILKSILIPMAHSRDTINIIKSYVRKNKQTKIVRF
jgi:DNA polymerase-3 subunit epsilon